MDQFTQQPQPQMQTLNSQLNNLKAMANGNASGLIAYLKQTNPDFAAFARSVEGKTPQQAFAERGLDYSQFAKIL